jgi:hypothetical protein
MKPGDLVQLVWPFGLVEDALFIDDYIHPDHENPFFIPNPVCRVMTHRGILHVPRQNLFTQEELCETR